MTLQQMKNSERIIEADGVPSPTDQLNIATIDTPSIILANYNIQPTNIASFELPPESMDPVIKLLRSLQSPTELLPESTDPVIKLLLSLDWLCSYFGCYSQSIACIATRFGECSTTSLDRLWYLYSYIYKLFSSTTTTLISTILFLLVVVILMPTTNQPTTSSSIVNPSPHISQNRSFTIADYTSLIDWSFKFADHPHCEHFGVALNNTFSEDFDNAVVDGFFTNTNKTLVIADAFTVLHAAIIDIIMISSTANRNVVAQIINQMLVF